jgi:excisionase family DNA binding protein
MFSIEVVFKLKDRPVSGEQFADALVKELAESLKKQIHAIEIPRAQCVESLPKAAPAGLRESHPKPRLFSVRDTAATLGLKASTIRSYIGNRKIAVVRLGRRVMISAETIERILNEGLPRSR